MEVIPERPWALTPKAIVKELKTDLKKGLTEDEAKKRLEKYGANTLDEEVGKSLFELVLEQFDDPMVKILLMAAGISFVLAMLEEEKEGKEEHFLLKFVEPAVIITILVLNAIVGVWQESNAEAALEALKQLQPAEAIVLREGREVTMDAEDLVPGDIVKVSQGSKVPADMRVLTLNTTTLGADQSQLTGEADSVRKEPDEISVEDAVVQDQTNILFSSSAITYGSAYGVVTATGMSAEIGKIQKSITDVEEEVTPLKKKLNEFGDNLNNVIFWICVLVWAVNYSHFITWEDGKMAFNFEKCVYYFKIAVALAVAAIPEGLPAVITTCLALGTRKMAKKNAIVRKLPSVETLGCCSVICSDKTGTLTTNEMTVRKFWVFGERQTQERSFTVDGSSYDPLAAISPVPEVGTDDPLNDFASICTLCNSANLTYDTEKGKYSRQGEPTEAAMKVLVEKMGTPNAKQTADFKAKKAAAPVDNVEIMNKFYADQYEKLATLEFSRDRKSMSVLCRKNGAKSNCLLVKGAPEMLLPRCTSVRTTDGEKKLQKAGREAVLAEIDAMALQGLRCLGLAIKTSKLGELSDYDGKDHTHPAHKSLQKVEDFINVEQDLTFVGLVGMLDPPRPEVKDALAKCSLAGVRVIVITGDNQKTAESICRKIGLFEEGNDMEGLSFTGTEFFKLSDEKKLDVLRAKPGQTGARVFSRTEPTHKKEICRLLNSLGEVTAMTGDGVNDAPALKQANIGIAMGITGTEVAKQASDMVLADDNFATIVSAIEEGRSIYNNMQAFIRYLISSNIGEVAAIFLVAVSGMPEGLTPVQLLWVNLVTDGPPATALGFNPADANIMKVLPRRTDAQLITPWVFFRYMVVGIYVGFACCGVFAYWYMAYDASGDGHTLISFDQLVHWDKCSEWTKETFDPSSFHDGQKFLDLSENPCDYFSAEGKVKASTLSLSVLVTIEMLNALNALSENGSLVQMPPWVNPYLLLAMALSMGMHAVILYIPPLAGIFGVAPLDLNEWLVVMYFSMPVIFIDEVLKLAGRYFDAKELADRMKARKAE